MYDLTGRVALVTGAAAGLGAADCEALAEAGAYVFVTDVSKAGAEEAAARLQKKATPLELDVSRETHWAHAFNEVDRAFGRLDILVNNAGICLVGDVETQTLEQFRRTQAIMSEGVFLGCKAMLPALKRSPHASIINISSIASFRGYPDVIAYAAAKGAVTAMTKAIAVMCQNKGYPIRCNSIHPGDIETPMQRAFDGRSEPKAVPAGMLPRGAVGAPSDVAAMVVFLASDAARFITGAELVVDNGAVARAGW